MAPSGYARYTIREGIKEAPRSGNPHVRHAERGSRPEFTTADDGRGLERESRRSGSQREIFSVQEAAARALVDLRPGEMVRITYVQVNGQLRAQRIVKAPGSTSVSPP